MLPLFISFWYSPRLPPFTMYSTSFDTLLDTFWFLGKTKSTRNAVFTAFLVLYLTGDERIELPLRVLETPVIPFDQSPLFNLWPHLVTRYLYHIKILMSTTIIIFFNLYSIFWRFLHMLNLYAKYNICIMKERKTIIWRNSNQLSSLHYLHSLL